MQEEQKEKILKFIKSQKYATLATSNKQGIPEAAMVAVSEMENLELIFGCFADARKYKNLLECPKVAVVFIESKISIQYEGFAREVIGEEIRQLQEIHIAKHADSAKYLSHPAEKYFIITPVWIRYMDHEAKPNEDWDIRL